MESNVNFVTLRATGPTVLFSLKTLIIEHVINYPAGEVEHVRKLGSGDLHIKVNNPSQVNDLLKLRKFHCFDVTASIPVGTSSSRVVICWDLMFTSEEDKVQEL